MPLIHFNTPPVVEPVAMADIDGIKNDLLADDTFICAVHNKTASLVAISAKAQLALAATLEAEGATPIPE